jgi:hypothetical protein
MIFIKIQKLPSAQQVGDQMKIHHSDPGRYQVTMPLTNWGGSLPEQRPWIPQGRRDCNIQWARFVRCVAPLLLDVVVEKGGLVQERQVCQGLLRLNGPLGGIRCGRRYGSVRLECLFNADVASEHNPFKA